MNENIIEHHFNITRELKEKRYSQKGHVYWLTGLSGSGKSTIANEVEKKLFEMGHITTILDGDSVRSNLCKDLSFSQSDRQENIRRIAEVAKLFADNAIITLCCFIAPLNEQRELINNILGDNVSWIYIKTSLSECEKRDPKGLYKKARAGKIKDFTGIDSSYDEPKNPDLILDTEKYSLEELSTKLVEFITQ